MKFTHTVAAALLSLIPKVACQLVNSEQLQADLTTEKLMANLEALNDIAFANGGNRAFGLPGYAASVDYVWGRVGNISGTKAWKQDFTALFAQVTSIDVKVNDQDFYAIGLTYSPSTDDVGIMAQLVAGPQGEAGCDVANYDGLDVEGKIVLIDRFRCATGGTLAGRLIPAAAAGAVAVLIYNDAAMNVTAGTLSQPNPDIYVPGGFINQVDGRALKARLDAGEALEAYFQQTQIIEERVTQNIIVETLEGDPSNVIVLGAHLDSVQAGPGINDDGSGSSLVLEIFDAFRKYQTVNKVRFAWWAAEENGLLGSEYYTSTLPAAEANNILAYLNFDMVSRGYYGIGDGDGSTHGSVAPAGSEVIEKIYIDYFTGRGLDVTAAILTNGSDYASFWEYLNKPFGFLNTGTAFAQDPCYHQACDTIDNPNPEVITNNAKAAAHMLATLAVDGTTLIPKTQVPVNATMLNPLRTRSVGLDSAQIAELEALGERHLLGCGHEV